jgi:hypothetical protein
VPIGAHQLQLAIYAAAARAGLAAGGEVRADARADGAFLSIRKGRRTRTLSTVLGDDDLEALLDRGLSARVVELTAGIREGHFPPRPLDCRGCDYRTVCRVVALAEEEEGTS